MEYSIYFSNDTGDATDLKQLSDRQRDVISGFLGLLDAYHNAGGWTPADSAKCEIIFYHPQTLRGRTRYSHRTGTIFQTTLFISDFYGLAYTNSGRNGLAFDWNQLMDIRKITLVTEDKKLLDKVHKIEQIAGKIHPNAWQDIKDKLKKPDELAHYARNYGTALISMRSHLDERIISQLEHAFANRTAMEYTWEGPKRHFSVSTQQSDDGVFRAWFSSEYAGCLNGQYYVLINPYYATFMEKD